MIRHLRRPDPNPDQGFRIIRCDCGWEERTPDMCRSAEALESSLEQLFRQHLPAAEARTHLLCDTREPESNRALEDIRAELVEQEQDPARAEAIFAAQPQIVGTFLMPIGIPVMLLGSELRDGVHVGRFSEDGGPEQELPIGEVVTPVGRVFRLDE
jgi:hypothetical protein